MSQNAKILSYMEQHGTISAMDAMRDLGVMRLASRIHDLREAGFEIVDIWCEERNRYGEAKRWKEYRLGKHS